MAGETETVALNLSGDFAAQAAKDAQAATKLEQALEKLGAAREKSAKASPMVDALAGSSGYSKLSAVVSKVFGDAAGAKLDGAAAKLAVGADKLGVTPGMLETAGGALAGAGGVVLSAGKVVLEAAAALAVAAAGVVAAGVKFGVEQTDAAETQKTIFGAIKGGAGGQKIAVDLALDLGLDEGKTNAEVKRLLQAKFTKEQIKVDVKVAAAIDAVEGEGKGQEYLDKLAKLKLEPKVNARDIKGLAELGLDTKDVYAELAKTLGITVAQAEAKVKSGAVDTQSVIDAIGKSADKSFGGVADKLGNSIQALLMKVKLGFAELFKGFDLGPLKGFLNNVVDTLKSPEGKAMGKAFADLGSTIIKTLFGPLDGSSGKDKLKAIVVFITQTVNKITAGIVAAKPYVKSAIDFFKDLFAPKEGSNGPGAKVRELATFLASLAGPAAAAGKAVLGFYSATWPILKLPVGAFFSVLSVGLKIGAAGFDLIAAPIRRGVAAVQGLLKYLGITGAAAKTGGKGIGDAIGTGILGGITGKIGAVVAAAGAMAGAALAKIKTLLGVASPAKALVFVGDMMGAGMAKGMNDNGAPAKAGAKMAAGAAASAAANAGGGKGGGGGAPAAAPVFNIIINAAPGMTNAQANGLAGAAVDGAYEAHKKNARRLAREQQEGKAA